MVNMNYWFRIFRTNFLQGFIQGPLLTPLSNKHLIRDSSQPSPLDYPLTSHNPSPLGRWALNSCPNKMARKVDWANEDHCGPCGSNSLQRMK